MKRLFVFLLAVMLFTGTAAADSPFFQCSSWNPADVDLSGVEVIDGRLVGVIKLPAKDLHGWHAGELRVNCPLPAQLTAEQQVTLRVRRKPISAAALLDALGDAAEPTALYESNGMETLVSYTAEAELDSCYFPHTLSDASLSAESAYAAEAAQAKATVSDLIRLLGGQPAENLLHANRRDAAHADWYSQTENSSAAEMSAKRRAQFEQMEARNGRTGGYTMVRGLYELRGLPVMDQFYVQTDDGWIGAGSEFRAAVRDDGTIRFAEITGLPEVIRAEPLELPAFRWQDLLRQAVAKLCASNAHPTDEVLADGTVVYAGYSVITDLKPCWVGLSADTLVPGWYCVTEQRVQKDDSLASVWALYGDAQTLME